ncbi:MAG TPA: zf-HC2 domain-containing protein [Candidatus Limnocylindrales bacterium]|nr:zf-HC2 domain-containing protein [Candidatus Limnocylindrales bacterium]
MNDHETYLLLAAKRMTEPLTHDEETELERHLASCPDCRAIAAGMRRDDIRLRAVLAAPIPVAPRVRERVLAEAAGSRRSRWPVTLLLAAALALGLMAVPLIAGRFREPAASESPSASTAAVASSEAPSATVEVSPSVEPTQQPSAATVPPGTGPTVNANYVYFDRIDSVAARLEDGKPVGEWWRQTQVDGKTQSYAGPITCLVIDGNDAWLAGPATSATDGRSGLAIFFRLHDGGPNGAGDAARGYLSNPGQSLTTMQTWCETKYTQPEVTPLTSGDVSIDEGA